MADIKIKVLKVVHKILSCHFKCFIKNYLETTSNFVDFF